MKGYWRFQEKQHILPEGYGIHLPSSLNVLVCLFVFLLSLEKGCPEMIALNNMLFTLSALWDVVMELLLLNFSSNDTAVIVM